MQLNLRVILLNATPSHDPSVPLLPKWMSQYCAVAEPCQMCR